MRRDQLKTTLSRMNSSRQFSRQHSTINSLTKIKSMQLDQGGAQNNGRDLPYPSFRSISKTTPLPLLNLPDSLTIREKADLMKKHDQLLKRKEMTRSAKLKPLTHRSTSAMEKSTNSYLLIQKRKQVEPSAAKISWQALQNMKLNDIKGYFHDGFEPRDLIEKDSDEDNEFMPGIRVAEPQTSRHEDRSSRYGAIETWQTALEKGRSRLVPQTLVSRSMAIRQSQSHARRDIQTMLHNK